MQRGALGVLLSFCWALPSGCFYRSDVGFADLAGSSLAVSKAGAVADGHDAIDITLLLKDHTGRSVTGIPVTFVADRSNCSLVQPVTASEPQGQAMGRITCTAAGLVRIGVRVLTDTGVVLLPLTAQVRFGDISLLITADPNSGIAGSPTTLNIAAVQADGEVSSWYVGTLGFASSDPLATLPPDAVFKPADRGQKRIVGTVLRRSGVQWIWAVDRAVPSVSGSAEVGVLHDNNINLNVSFAPPIATAGDSVTVIITVTDSFGNPVPDYSDIAHLTSPDPQAVLPPDLPFTTDDMGVAVLQVPVSWDTAGQQTLVVTTAGGGVSGQGTVLVTAAAAARLAVTGPATIVAGTAVAVPVQVVDAYGNAVTSFTGQISLTSSDPAAPPPTPYTLTAGDLGQHTFTATLFTATTQTITASTLGLTGSQSVSVQPAGAKTLVLSGFGSPIAAGTMSAGTITAFDPYGNIATGYTGTVTLSSTSTLATGLPVVYTFLASEAGVHTYNASLNTAGTQRITATDAINTGINGSQLVVVQPGSAAGLLVNGFPSPTTAGVVSSVTVTAVDSYGNVATGYVGTVNIGSTAAATGLPASHTFTVGIAGDNGVYALNAALKTAGDQVITATDNAAPSITGSQTVTVQAAACVGFALSGFPSPTLAGALGAVTITAQDAFGNTATDYVGTVNLATTSPLATGLPTTYTFAAADKGQHAETVALNSQGTQSITAADSAVPAHGGAQHNIVVNPAPTSALQVTASPNTLTAGSTVTVTVIAADPYGNVTPGYTGTVQFTSDDPQMPAVSNYGFNGGDNGSHSFANYITLKTAGARTITVTDTSTTTITGSQSGITVNPSSASKLLFSPTTLPAQSICTVIANLQVAVSDAYGNTVPGATNTITLGLTGNSNFATLGGTLSQAAVAGVATFGTVSINRLGSTYQLTASASGFTPISSNVFSVTNVPPTVLPIPALSASSGNIAVVYAVRDVCADVADVKIEYDPNSSGTFSRATQAGSTSNAYQGVNAVPTSSASAGQSLAFLWNSAHDMAHINSTNAVLRITASTRGVAGSPVTLSPVTITNGVQLSTTSTARGSSQTCFALADFNHDAYLDLATCDGSTNKLSVLLANRSGGFGAPTDYALSATPTAIATGDLNHDGAMDVVVAQVGTSVALYKGSATGALTANGTVTVGTNPNAVLLVDINRDGNVDLITANSGAGSISYALGNGAGGFAAASTLVTAAGPGGLATGDFNHDGNADLLVSNTAAGSISVVQGSRTGALSVSATLSGLGAPVGIAVRDINRDGKADFVAADSANGEVWVGVAGATAYTFTITSFAAGAGATAVALADMDGDAITDCIVANSGANTIGVALGDRTGAFGTPLQFNTVGASPVALAVTDINHDNKNDVIATTSTGNTVEVMLGAWSRAPWDLATPFVFVPSNGPVGVTTGDFNLDGKIDVALTAPTGNLLMVWPGDGAGGFGTVTTVATGTTPYYPATGDLNRDGKADVVVPNYGSNNLTVLLGNGTGGFVSSTVACGTGPRHVAIADVNKDGAPDVVTANFSAGTASVLLGNGTGGLSLGSTVTTAAGSNYVVLVDIDGDSSLDLLTTNETAATFSVAHGNGAGTFAAPTATTTGAAPRGLVVGDFNSDGKLDVATVNRGPGTIGVYLATSPGVFGAANSTLTVGANPNALLTLDVNGDGKLDLVSIVGGTSQLSINLGAGNGTFAAATAYDVTQGGLVQMAAADLNGDGSSDLVLTDTSEVTVVRSSGSGGLLVPTTTPLGFTIGTVTELILPVADVNNDGISDLILFDNADKAQIFLGTAAGTFAAPIAAALGADGGTVYQCVQPADLDGDGWIDLVASCHYGATSTSSNTAVLINQHNSTFGTATVNTYAGGPIQYMTIADINHDSIDDVLLSQNQSGGIHSISVTLSNGAGGLSGATQNPCNTTTIDVVAAGDINNDGALDVAFGATNIGETGFMLGHGTATLTPIAGVTMDTVTAVSYLMDLNWDGKLDTVAEGGGDSSKLFVRLGNGDGTFGALTTYTGQLDAGGGIALEMLDFDADGNQDFFRLTTKGFDQIQFGTGSGTLGAPRYFVANAGLATVLDVNADGKPDVIGIDNTLTRFVVVLGR